MLKKRRLTEQGLNVPIYYTRSLTPKHYGWLTDHTSRLSDIRAKQHNYSTLVEWWWAVCNAAMGPIRRLRV